MLPVGCTHQVVFCMLKPIDTKSAGHCITLWIDNGDNVTRAAFPTVTRAS